MFQCNEHVEMNKFLCSLACTWVTTIDSQVILLTAYLWMFHLNEMLTWWLPCCKTYVKTVINDTNLKYRQFIGVIM